MSSAKDAPSSDEIPQRIDMLARSLSSQTRGTDELLATLNVSQATLSRTIHALPGALQFRVTGVRTPRYGLLRRLPGNLAAQQKVYRITPQGGIAEVGMVSLLAGGETLTQFGAVNRLYVSLPPAMTFAAPSGFLGRQAAHSVAAELQLPESLRDWSNDHRAAFLIARGSNLPGDLVFGDSALAQALDARKAAPVASHKKLQAYSAMTVAIQSAAAGSSAGGEQPKFLAYTEDNGHVIVKFAALGTRMAELLQMECVALECLANAGLPCAKARFLAHEGHAFLEVERFDRAGATGRIGMVSAGALDDELFGQRDSWSQFAQRCESSRLLKPASAQRLHTMAAYSELIANTDRHFENISLMLDERGEVSDLAPAYDLLPMKYAPIGGGIDPALSRVAPKLGSIGGRAEVWAVASLAATAFWSRCRDDQSLSLSQSMRELAAENLVVVREFVEPLIGRVV